MAQTVNCRSFSSLVPFVQSCAFTGSCPHARKGDPGPVFGKDFLTDAPHFLETSPQEVLDRVRHWNDSLGLLGLRREIISPLYRDRAFLEVNVAPS